MRIASYARELRFALSATTSWRSCLRLLTTTLGFHLTNFTGRRRGGRRPIVINLRIGATERAIAVRPGSGDIFVLYEVLAFESYRLPESICNPASVASILDCGANIGITALFLAERYPNARIVCVEPDPANFALLQMNVQAEPRIVSVQAAVIGDARPTAYLTQDRETWGNRIAASGEGAAIEVPGATIEELCERHGMVGIDLLKVDVEGAEEELFRRPSFLPRVRCVAVELHGNYDLNRFKSDISGMGFEIVCPTSDKDGPGVLTAVRAAGRE